jgi:hypothetical protein
MGKPIKPIQKAPIEFAGREFYAWNTGNQRAPLKPIYPTVPRFSDRRYHQFRQAPGFG